MIKFFCIWISYIQTNRTKDYNHQVPFNIQETPGYNQKENVKKMLINKKANLKTKLISMYGLKKRHNKDTRKN